MFNVVLLFQKLLFQKLLFPFVPRMSNDFLKNNSRLEQKRKGQFWITPKTPLFSRVNTPLEHLFLRTPSQQHATIQRHQPPF